MNNHSAADGLFRPLFCMKGCEPVNQRKEAEGIIQAVLEASNPEPLVAKAVAELPPCEGRTILLAVGKAAFAMALAALTTPGFTAHRAMIVTKYGHTNEKQLSALPKSIRTILHIREAGHPISDANSYRAAEEAIAMVQNLTANDRVVLLLSGGGSALFEKPLLSADEMEDINQQLLCSGADIGEINTIRKRLSAVKGGRFAQLCAPAQVITIALSDVLSNAPDQIASGIGCPDPTTCAEAKGIVTHYALNISLKAQQLLETETPKELPNAATKIIGGMTFARAAAARACAQHGYRVLLFQPHLTCQARDAGRFFGGLARRAARQGRRLAIVAGGETVVNLGTQHGLGGRNQEMALAASLSLQGIPGVCFFSLGTDGTDGPTDAAGGMADGETVRMIAASDVTTAQEALDAHDAYHALKAADSLLITGPTGTNVNDVCVALVDAGRVRNRSGKTTEEQAKSCIQD